MQGRKLREVVRGGSISSFFYLERRLRPDGTLNVERIVLSLVYTKIAGCVPSWTSLQVLESKVLAPKNAEECPYLVEGRCPHTGTGPTGGRSTFCRMEGDGKIGANVETNQARHG